MALASIWTACKKLLFNITLPPNTFTVLLSCHIYSTSLPQRGDGMAEGVGLLGGLGTELLMKKHDGAKGLQQRFLICHSCKDNKNVTCQGLVVIFIVGNQTV